MPMLKRDIPEWFDCISTQESPLLWARKKFPIAALALVFQEVKERDTFSEFEDAIRMSTGFMGWHTVSLHLFIDGQEICGRDYHHFTVGEDHVLLCDLRVLFSDEEWQGLDASIGDDWKVIQVQYHSDMVLSKWGVYAYKQETNMDDIQFRLPNPNSIRDHMQSSLLVPNVSEEKRMRYMLESFNPRDMFNQYLPLLESEGSPGISVKIYLRSLREVKAEIREKTSASSYGASLKQEHEESVDDVVQILEMMKENIPKHVAESCPQDLQVAGGFAERILRARIEIMKENGFEFGMPIILEYTDTGGDTLRRIWGVLETKVGDPFFKAVLRRQNQLLWESWSSNEDSSSGSSLENLRVTIVVLKCHCPASEETSSSGYEESLEEGYYCPELEELMRKIEQDAMSLNKSYGKMKASIVRTDESISEKYLVESLVIRRLVALKRLTMFGAMIKFKKTPYGMIRVDDDPFVTLKMCIWGSAFVLMVLIILLFYLMVRVGIFLYRIPIIRKFFACGWWLVMQILVACKYLYWRIGQIMKRKEKEL